jgi:protein involved in polysaccharide export with SLBB domain
VRTAMRKRRELLRRIGAGTFPMAFALLFCCAGLNAQSAVNRRSSPDSAPTSPKSDTFELEKENSSRVAASPEQIREILVKDPGLLVELKYWISKEATANGQVVDDTDLTDHAIFERLAEDLVFRAAATRLLQRYGYLRPAVNPDSELGKEQELVLKERARRLVQIEEQEDAESLQQRREEQEVQQTTQRNEACDQRRDENCSEKVPQRSRMGNAEPDVPGRPKSDLPPAPAPTDSSSSEPILRAGLNLNIGPAEASTLGLESGGDVPRLATIAASRGILPSRNQPGGTDISALGLTGSGASLDPISSLLNARSASSSSNSDSTRPNSEPTTRSRISPPFQREKDLSQGAIVHKQNPYAEIPSLYDLYVQAPARERAPERFGIDILSSGLRESNVVPMDLPVGPDYVVGPGDSLAIDLWGGISQRLVRTVDRQGRVSLPEAGPLLVSGRTLGDVQLTVQQALRSQFRDTSADVSLSKLRTIRVYVVGEVLEPGAYDISSLSTPLNALVAAGGITPRGSLRSLKHYRGNQLIEVVDAYDLLLRGVGTDEKRLENGDSLLVPPAGAQVTIEGMVRRPAIYELSGETTLEDALELAGGVLPAAALQHVEVERLVAHQKRTMFSLDLSPEDGADAVTPKLSNFKVQDGDRVHIFPIAPYNNQAIYLQGHVLRPGRYSYREGMKLGDLVNSYSDLLPEPAGNYAEIIRLNPPDFRPTVESFDLTAALANPGSSPKLMPLDTVRIFSKFEFESAPDVWVGGEVRQPGLYPTAGQIRLRDAVHLAGGVTANAELDSAQLFRTSKDGTLKILSVNLSDALAGSATDNVLLEPHDRLIVHRNSAKVDPPTVYVKGEVAKPGRYPLTSNMHVEDLVRVAGGLKRSADPQNAVLAHQEEETSQGTHVASVPVNLVAAMNGDPAANEALNNGDVLTIRQASGWENLGASVKIRGEVTHPGTYGIRPGDSLATLLAKAGGFTSEAYPYGTVLTRAEVREIELKTHNELVMRVQAEAVQLKSLPEGDGDQKKVKLAAIAQTETTLTQLETNLPVGRVVIQSPPDLKAFEKSAANTPLRKGDVIIVPKKANYVLVNGQVYNSTAIGYVPGRSARWYLGQAGGLTQLANKKAVFVIRANGSVLSAQNNSSVWSGDPLGAVLLPGDSIVVPEKPPKVGVRNWAPLIQTAQVATSVALAVAYVHP